MIELKVKKLLEVSVLPEKYYFDDCSNDLFVVIQRILATER